MAELSSDVGSAVDGLKLAQPASHIISKSVSERMGLARCLKHRAEPRNGFGRLIARM